MQQFERWLNRKVNDPTICSKYERSKYTLDLILRKYEPTKAYSFYYKDDDIDVRNNNINNPHLYLLEIFREDDFEPEDKNELDQLEYLDRIIERYRPKSFFRQLNIERGIEDENKWNAVGTDITPTIDENDKKKEDTREIDIFIPPHTNRYHTNHLFKCMVQYSIINNMRYEIEDPQTGEFKTEILIDPELKEAFYKF